jgi:glycosyltransferase involved in cell wall biosynthesis
VSSYSGASSKRWIVAQLGAREHYLAARALHGLGALDCLLTDVWEPGGRRGGPFGTVLGLRAARPNWHPKLADADVRAWGLAGAAHRLAVGALARREGWLHRWYETQGTAFARWTARQLETRDPSRAVFLGFSSTCLEALTRAKARGMPCIVDQIDPGSVERDLIAEERSRWQGWEVHGGPPNGRLLARYDERVRREWEAADRIVVNSEWSRAAVLGQGADARKLVVVPLAYELDVATGSAAASPRRRMPRLQVLWLGSVILRKGFPYLVEAARQLAAEPIDFVIAGPHRLSSEVVASLPPNVRLLGKVSSSVSERLYREADVFVLPTISDGFAITQLEAMAHGLPVVTTTHCGDVVREGVDGYLVPARDGGALAARLSALAHDAELLERLSAAASRRAGDFSVATYAQRLTSLVASL